MSGRKKNQKRLAVISAAMEHHFRRWKRFPCKHVLCCWMYVKSRAVGQTLGKTNARHCLLKPPTAAGLLCLDRPAKPVERTSGCSTGAFMKLKWNMQIVYICCMPLLWCLGTVVFKCLPARKRVVLLTKTFRGETKHLICQSGLTRCSRAV